MNPKGSSFPTFHDPDLEAQVTSDGSVGSHAPKFHAPFKPASNRNSSGSKEPSSPHSSNVVGEENSPENGAEVPSNTAQTESGWKPWKLDDPYRTKVPKDEQAIEGWVKAMKESDGGMCQGWRDQIDTLIIFAGLFSATVTAFTVESYQWLDETPAEIVARLQLRALLSGAHDIDRLAPATFNVSPASVLINTLWFASLTLSLAAVIISFLCKQWLYEYQRYDNVTTEEAFLIQGLRYRGLRAWRVPEIIASLPLLLQIALALFLVGVLVLLWHLQTVVAWITTAIVGLTFLFLGMTTILPAIQYIYPKFDTQCAYKSSQSWSFFVFSAFWLFDFSMFTTWAAFDRWEVTCISNGAGHTLSRVYELLANSVDSFHSIYSFLADTSLRPTIKADFTLVFDFVDGLDVSRKEDIISHTDTAATKKHSKVFRRVAQLKGYIDQYRKAIGRLKPAFEMNSEDFKSGFRKHETTASQAYHLQVQRTLSHFLRRDIHFSNPAIINRYVEHWARCIDKAGNKVEERTQRTKQWEDIYWPIEHARRGHIHWDPDIASHLVEMYSHLLEAERISVDAIRLLSVAYPSLVESHQQHDYNPPPFTLLKDIQEWISRMPESDPIDLVTKVDHVQHVLYRLVYKSNNFGEHSHVSGPSEKQYLRAFAQFFVEFFERGDILTKYRESSWTAEYTDQSLVVLHKYLIQNLPVSS